MRGAVVRWLAMVLCALPLLALATPALVPVRVDPAIDLRVGPLAQVLEDRSHTLTLTEARRSEGWRRNTAQTLHFGFSDAFWWVRFQVVNPGANAQRLVLEAGEPVQDYIDYHLVDVDGRVLAEAQSGDRLAFAQRPVRARALAFELALQPGQVAEVYLRMRSHDGLFEAMPMRLSTAEAFSLRVERDTLWQGLYYGGLLALALYNLFIFLSTRTAAFGLYVLYMAAFLVWSATLQGFSLQYVWPDAPDFNNQALPLAGSLIFVTLNLFAMNYLRLSERLSRRWVRVVRTVVLLNLLPVPLALLDQYALAWKVTIALGAIVNLLMMGIAARLLAQGAREARFYILSFALLGVGVVLQILQLVAVVPASDWTNRVWQLGSVFEMLLLALALADNMNQLKAQSLRAEQQAGRAQAALATGLEREVRKRTLELEQANRLLQQLSITDELTGAFNRRHFNALCRDALEPERQSLPIAMCMFDIDYFKAFNDIYGHQAGDQALQAVAQAVQQELQPSGDRLCRLGGEEFGALLSVAGPEAAQRLVARLRDAVRTLARTHEGSPHGRLTASFGVAWWDGAALDRLHPDGMYACVDQLLYAAKQAGRDRVVFRASGSPAPPPPVRADPVEGAA